MSVKIRLMRVGKKKQPSYRVVVADGRSPRDGRYIEIIGHYQPRQEPSGFDIDDDKVLSWLQKGAQPTEQVHKLLVGAGIWETYESIAQLAVDRGQGRDAARPRARRPRRPRRPRRRRRRRRRRRPRPRRREAAAAAEAKAAEAKAAEAAARPAEDAPAEESTES